MTGYVHKMIDDHQDFRQFALSCARAFGARVHLRDERMDAPIRLPEPSDYHDKALASAREKLARLLAMTEPEREEEGVNRRTNTVVERERSTREELEKIARCQEMLARVEEWTPPTAEHEGLKEFMREQLTTSIGDGGDYWRARLDELKAKPPEQYFDEAVESARWDIAYHEREGAAERARVAENVAWIQALLDGVGAKP